MHAAAATGGRGAGTELTGFGMRVAEAGRRVLARVHGPLDGESTHRLVTSLSGGRTDSRQMILDLRDAAYIDSDGIRVLVRLLEAQERSGGGVRLVVRRGSSIQRALTLLSLSERFSTSESVSEHWLSRGDRRFAARVQ